MLNKQTTGKWPDGENCKMLTHDVFKADVTGVITTSSMWLPEWVGKSTCWTTLHEESTLKNCWVWVIGNLN